MDTLFLGLTVEGRPLCSCWGLTVGRWSAGLSAGRLARVWVWWCNGLEVQINVKGWWRLWQVWGRVA